MPNTNDFVIMPAPEQFSVLNLLTICVLMIHLSYMGTLLFSCGFSLFFQAVAFFHRKPHLRQTAKQLIFPSIWRPGPMIILGIVPLITLSLLYSQLMFGSNLSVFKFFTVIIGFALAGFILLAFYMKGIDSTGKASLVRWIAGIAGAACFKQAYFILISSSSLFMSPEDWTLIRTPVPLIFSANVIARFFLLINILATAGGLGILYFTNKWQPGTLSAVEKTFHRRLGGGLVMAAIIGLPIPMLWNLITLPSFALNGVLIVMYTFVLLISLWLTIRMTGIISQPEKSFGAVSLVLFLLCMAGLFVADNSARGTAMQESHRVLSAKALKIRRELEEKRGVHGGGEASVAAGEVVFKNRCALCHAFDRRIVGPPYKETLVKYEGKMEMLESFIQNPKRVNPDYPPMPSLGLKTLEVKSVALYIMDRYEKKE